jgi:UDP-galactose transporter B1
MFLVSIFIRVISCPNHSFPLVMGDRTRTVYGILLTFLQINELIMPVVYTVSVPFQSIYDNSSDKFGSALFMGTCQSALSSLSALLYLLARRKSGEPLVQTLGLHFTSAQSLTNGKHVPNGSSHTKKNTQQAPPPTSNRWLLHRYLQCSLFITAAAPFGFAALSYISYPAMVLGKSCKLVPVMVMNVFLYGRRFAPHKYLVVFMVTTGITIFMGFGSESPASSKYTKGQTHATAYANAIGITYLFINLALDGAINSTQDEIFTRYKLSGQQMMVWINIFCTMNSLFLSVLPLPYIPVIHPSTSGRTELGDALQFIRSHPSIIVPLAQFAFTGALGQLFIYETLQHFGSLTLV